MSRLKEALETGKFGVTAEMAPPKGYDFTEQLEAGKLLAPKVHAVNVTDMQSASLKASSLGLCIALKNAGVEPILQMTGRDRNRMAIMADVLSAASFGIDSVLALTGDHPVVGDCKDAKPVYDLDSVGILNMLTKMEQTNCDCGGNEIAGGAPKLYKGASVTPVYEPVFLQINKLRQKVEAGASFVQTQGIFDLDAFKRFLEQVDAAGIKTHVMAGIIPLKSAGMARYMNENVPGIAVPQEMIDRLAAAAEEGKAKGVKGLPMKLGMEMAAEMIAKIKDEHLCDGVHIMAIGAEKLGEFCEKHHIVNVISGDLHDPEAIAALRKHGVKLARSVNYKMNEDDIQRCINTDGFTYMQAFPSEGQYVKPGFEELETCIRYLRERKVSEPIYCGAGIKSPADAARVKAAGGQGFFVGSSIIKLYDTPEQLVELIRDYKKAAQN